MAGAVQDSFQGFVREDGTAGVRNHLLVLSTGSVTTTAPASEAAMRRAVRPVRPPDRKSVV